MRIFCSSIFLVPPATMRAIFCHKIYLLFLICPCAEHSEEKCASCEKAIRVLKEVSFSSAGFPKGSLLVHSNSCS